MQSQTPPPHSWRRRVQHALAAAAVLVLAGGCFDFDQELFVNEDGSGRSVLRYAALESFVASSAMARFMQPGTKDMLMNKQAIVDHFATLDGVRLSKVDLWAEGETRYVRAHIDFEDVNALSTRGVAYSWRVEGEHKVFKITLDRDYGRGAKGKLQEQLAAGLMKNGFRFKVHLPRKIVESNAKNVDWSVAEWYVPLGFFIHPDAKTIQLYAKVEAGTWDRVKAWILQLLPQ